jgi:hypothetical protein
MGNITNKEDNIDMEIESLEDIDGIQKEPPVVKKINNLSIEWAIMLTLQDNLNLRIGSTTWKKYISAAFWNYISTPINFTITLFTAFSAGQTGTETIYLTKDQLFYILMTTFLLSVINTFFKLKEKAVLNFNACNQYNKFGSQFEDIYFTPITSDEDVIKRLNDYKALQKKMNEYNEEENVENVNYLTTLLYYSIKYFFKHRMKRINKDERFWLLDGKPNNEFYPRNRYDVKTTEYFAHDFNFFNHVDKNNVFKIFHHDAKFLDFTKRNGHLTEVFHLTPNEQDDTIQGIELGNCSRKTKKMRPNVEECSIDSNNTENYSNDIYNEQVCCATNV